MDHTENTNNDIKHKIKVGYLKITLIFSSLQIPLLHLAATFNTKAEGGRMVKEWDFEAEKTSIQEWRTINHSTALCF